MFRNDEVYVIEKFDKIKNCYVFWNVVSTYKEAKDHIYKLTSNDTQENKLFRSVQDLDDWKESEYLYNDIRIFFDSFYNNLTLDQLRRIKNIIDERSV